MGAGEAVAGCVAPPQKHHDMTRKRERRARILRWAATMVVGLLGAGTLLAFTSEPAGWLLAPLCLMGAAAIGHRFMIAPPGVAILTYHSVSPAPGWLPWSREVAVHPRTFARHLEVLQRIGAAVLPTRVLVTHRAAGAALPQRPVAIHFDDGYYDNHRFAAPLLRQHGFGATFFPSLDFIEPDGSPRREDVAEGYMRWSELAELAAVPGFEVEPHGVAHARVPVSDRTVGILDSSNWRANAWLQWAATPGPKYDWFRQSAPVAVPLGTPIPASGLALAVPAWIGGAPETPHAFASRIEGDLSECRATFLARLGYVPRIFCWPENKSCAEGRQIARSIGYTATTGGTGRNTADEPPEILSRIHIGDRALGFRWLAAEALHFRASVRLMQGNHYWYLVLAPMNLTRRLVFALRRLLRDDFS